MRDLGGGRIALPAAENGPGPAGRPPQVRPKGDHGGRRSGRGAPWRLKNWRVRWRLLALVIIPTVAAIVFGGVRIQAARDTSADFARVAHLAALGGDVTALTDAIEDERDLTAGFIAASQGGSGAEAKILLGQLGRQYAVTGAELATVRQQAAQIGPAYPAVARTDLSFALSRVSALSDLRGLAHSEFLPQPMIADYSDVVSTLLAFDDDIAAGSSSAQLAQTVSSLGSLAQLAEQASQQRATLYAALLPGQFGPGGLNALIAAQSGEASDLAVFQTAAGALPAYQPGSGFIASLTEEQQFNDEIVGPQIDEAQSIEQDALISGSGPLSDNAQTWYSDMSTDLTDIRGVESDELASIAAQASALQAGAQNSVKLTVAVVLGLLLLVLLVTIMMARSMILPLRRLRADALEVAGRRLPDLVQRLRESQGESENIEVEPIGIDSTDEIGEVARAFDQVHSEAARLAGDEALLRANLNAMFVNLSRRSQTLIERQLGIIESLEQSEQDSSRLSSLFRLDHLATRMRRNSENLLVLAGHEPPRKWTQPVSLVDVLRAAISEIEQYERITLNVQSGLLIAGRAASDVVHLVAELVENASAFSRKETQVHVTGQLLASGGMLIEITDEGLGIPEEELAHANWRLDNPPVIDVAVSRRMGLFVVGRLAARHGIRVRLRRSSDGLSALIWVPETVAETAPVPEASSRRRLGASGDPVMNSASAPPARMMGRRKSIWFDTGEDNQVQEPELPPRTMVPDFLPATPEPATPRLARTAPGAGPTPDAAPVRLPIYDSVESEWFRRSGPVPANGQPVTWTSPADEGFRLAAQTVSAPVAGQTTGAGLPRRMPSTNLVPGSVAARPPGRPASPEPPTAPGPARSPDAMRARLTGFQTRGRQRQPEEPPAGPTGYARSDEH